MQGMHEAINPSANSVTQQSMVKQEHYRCNTLAPLCPLGRWSSSAVRRSRVGQKLSDLTTLRVVIGILAVLLAVPAFNITSSLYGNPPTINYGGLSMLEQAYTQVEYPKILSAAPSGQPLFVFWCMFVPAGLICGSQSIPSASQSW